MEPNGAPPEHDRGFAHLGRGGGEDQLRFRLVIGLLLRCIPLLRPVAWPLVAVVMAGGILILLLAFPAINIVNIFWNGALEGNALSELQARMLWLPVESYADGVELLTEERKTLLRHIVVGTTGLFIVVGPFFVALGYARMWILQQVNQNLRLQMLDRLQALSLRFHSEQRTGDSIYRMFQDSAMVTQLIQVLFLAPLENFARLLFSTGVVFLWDPIFALMLASTWIPVLLLGHRFAKPLRRGFRSARETNSALTSRIQETLAGIKVIKAYGAEAREKERFERASLTAFDAAFDARSRYVVYTVLIFYAVGLLLVLGVGWGTHLSAEGAQLFGQRFFVGLGFAALNTGVWDLGFYNSFKDRIGDGSRAIHGLMGLWGSVQDVATGLDRVFELLDLEVEVEDAAGAVAMPPLRDGIRYRGVSFRYEASRPVLHDVDLEIAVGSVMAIVGPTGSGKSTLVSLLLRLYDPDAGSIEIDGRDLREVTIASLRAQISIALQENILFGTSVRENIRYAVPDASEAKVREAARVACADEFIEALPEGYDTLLGERGTKLSSGQRQRISIARALLKDTAILILDEPTAALDAATELRVLRNLSKWAEGRVVFLITHRLSTIRRADCVAVVARGTMTEQGTHSELMQREGGEYRRLMEAEEIPVASPAAPEVQA